MRKIVEFFKQCPYLKSYDLREDYLAPAAGSICFTYDGGEQVVKTYASGDMLSQLCFKLNFREFFTGEAGRVLDGVSDWIYQNSSNLPNLSEEKLSQYIEVAEGPSLIKTEVGSGIYEIKFRLVYYRRGVEDE